MKFEDTSLSPLDLTVSALIEQDGRFLIIEELSSGSVVLNQPGGHIEPGESPEDAVVREAMEESGCEIEVTSFLDSICGPILKQAKIFSASHTKLMS